MSEDLDRRLIDNSEKGNYDKVKRLLTLDTNVNYQDINGFTSLMYASMLGHIGIVKLILDSGANINLQNKWGWTALMFASYNDRVETVRLLLDYGADINIEDKGFTKAEELSGSQEVRKLLNDKYWQEELEKSFLFTD